jgi:hypothetical protein
MVHSDASIRKGIAGIGLYWGKGYWADAMVRSERPPSWVVKSTSAEFYVSLQRSQSSAGLLTLILGGDTGN